MDKKFSLKTKYYKSKAKRDHAFTTMRFCVISNFQILTWLKKMVGIVDNVDFAISSKPNQLLTKGDNALGFYITTISIPKHWSEFIDKNILNNSILSFPH